MVLKSSNTPAEDLLKCLLITLILKTPYTPAPVLIDTYLAFIKITKRDLARELDLSHTTINNVLSGKLRSGKSAEKVFNTIGIENPFK